MRRQVAAALALVGLVGCAPTTNFPKIDASLTEAEAQKQRIAALEAELSHVQRLDNISFPILVRNSDLCDDEVRHMVGIRTATLENYEDEWREAARVALGVGDRVTVLGIGKGSPAEKAGLAVNDKLLSIAGQDIGWGRSADKKFGDLLDRLAGDNLSEVKFVVDHHGEPRTLTIRPVVGCDYAVNFVHNDDVNAWADGKGEPLRVWRRPFCLSHAAMSDCFSMA